MIYIRKHTHYKASEKKNTIFFALRAYQTNNYNIISLPRRKKQTLQRLLCLPQSVNRVCFFFFFFFFALGWMPFLAVSCSLTHLSTIVCCFYQPSFLLVFLFCFVAAFTGRIQVSYSRFGGLLFSFLFFFYFLCCLLRLFLAFSSGSRAQTR